MSLNNSRFTRSNNNNNNTSSSKSKNNKNAKISAPKRKCPTEWENDRAAIVRALNPRLEIRSINWCSHLCYLDNSVNHPRGTNAKIRGIKSVVDKN